MNVLKSVGRYIRWPNSLASRLFLILLAGLFIAHGLSFVVLFTERYLTSEAMMLGNLEKDITTTVALLDRLPAEERPQWISMLQRRTHRYELSPGTAGSRELSSRGQEVARVVRTSIGARFPVEVVALPDKEQRFQAHLTLSDGAPLTIDVTPEVMPLARWLPYVLATQLVLLTGCSWLAVRFVTRPLSDLAKAADALEPERTTTPLALSGPIEVVHAARAFNAMRDRIAHYLEERMQILAAISHDLQTPITRMKLRVEVSEEPPDREKLLQDLSELEQLVHEGIDFARIARGNAEKPARIELGSFVESVVMDYQDVGKPVTLCKVARAVVVTQPRALRRILLNLIDNALKFAEEAEVSLEQVRDNAFCIAVRDRGPGIPADKLDAVLQPFFRLESSRSRATGGTGLGLTIAHRMAQTIGGNLRLSNRPEGGMNAEVMIPAAHHTD